MSLPPEIPQAPNRLNAQQEAANQLEEVQREMTGFERATLRWAKVAVGMSGVAALFVCLQWYEMHSGGQDTHDLAVQAKRQADKMKDMSDAADKIRQAAENMVVQDQRIADNAKNALDASNKQSKAALATSIASSRFDQRAWAGVTVALSFFNSGKTPARNVEFGVRYRTTPFPIDGPLQRDISALTFHASRSIAPQGRYINVVADAIILGGTFPNSVAEDNKTLISQFPLIKQGKLFLYYFGMLRYDDNVGKRHATQFCIYLADPSTKALGFCNRFNDMD